MRLLLRLLLLVPIGFILAVAVASLVWTAGTLRAFLDLSAAGYLLALAAVNMLPVGYYALIPALVAVAAAEWQGWRSPAFWGGYGVLLGVLAQTLPWLAFGPVLQRLLTYGAAGLAGGIVFWLIAGRLAGTGHAASLPPLGDQ
jgi:hypothetical protein